MTVEYSQLLDYLWRSGYFTGREFDAVGGEAVTVVSCGESDGWSGIWHGVQIVVDGERRRGNVIIGSAIADSVVLRLVDGYMPSLLDNEDRLVPQIEYSIEDSLAECYDRLRDGAGECYCGELIARMDSLRCADLFTKLLITRLQRKCGDVMKIFNDCGKDWNQTFYVMLLRAMGGNRNREVFTELASRVTYMMVSREKNSQDRVEALLLGGSGFLYDAEKSDSYTLRMENEFSHLAGKYSITPLKPAEWDLQKLYPRNHPAVRLAEIAALLSKSDFLLDNMLACRCVADLEKLFTAEASQYWETHYKPGMVSKESPKRIGKTKTHLIGINLTAPFMFAYGKEVGNDALCESALDLLETIPPEKNEKLVAWIERGAVLGSGFDSQALLELNNEFCENSECAHCPIGRSEIKKTVQRLSSAING